MEVVDRVGEFREFSYQPDKLETGFDFLNDIVAKGDTLLKVFLLDDHRVTILPVEAFKGIPFSIDIEQLELEWIAILDKHLSNQADDRKPITETKRLIGFYEKKIAKLELNIARMDRLVQRAEANNASGSPLNTHYKFILGQYTAQFIRNNLIYYRLTKLL